MAPLQRRASGLVLLLPALPVPRRLVRLNAIARRALAHAPIVTIIEAASGVAVVTGRLIVLPDLLQKFLQARFLLGRLTHSRFLHPMFLGRLFPIAWLDLRSAASVRSIPQAGNHALDPFGNRVEYPATDIGRLLDRLFRRMGELVTRGHGMEGPRVPVPVRAAAP
jgi:hypothetical protein